MHHTYTQTKKKEFACSKNSATASLKASPETGERTDDAAIQFFRPTSQDGDVHTHTKKKEGKNESKNESKMKMKKKMKKKKHEKVVEERKWAMKKTEK